MEANNGDSDTDVLYAISRKIRQDLNLSNEENDDQRDLKFEFGSRTSRDARCYVPPTNVFNETINKDDDSEKENISRQTSETSITSITVTNTRALCKNALTYELENFEKSALIIFNHITVVDHEDRTGTERDVEALTQTFEALNFEVVEHTDFTKAQIMQEMKLYSQKDFTDYGCVAVAILTHGSSYGELWANDDRYNETDILNFFKVHHNPTLVTKPKLFIIQACRGTRLTPGVIIRSARTRRDLNDQIEPYILPVESDMLVLHSSYAGTPSYRNEVKGSWFIQTLCGKINLLWDSHDLESIMVDIKREVAINENYAEYDRVTLEMEILKQMPVSTSTLIRKLYLKKYDSKSNVESYHDGSTPCQADTPSLRSRSLQCESCSCFLQHFDYLKNCLRIYIEDKPDDETAKSFLSIAEAYGDSSQFNFCKEQMARAISTHIYKQTQNDGNYRYIYFYNKDNNNTARDE